MKTDPDNYTRRRHKHDYYGPCAYHIILKKAPVAEKFGELIGDARIAPWHPGCASIRWSSLGRSIGLTIQDFENHFPVIKVYCFCIMPDHIHLFIQKKERTQKHLGIYMAHLKSRICKRHSAATGQNFTSDEIFLANYTDKPIYSARSFESVRLYIKENPHRLAMRRQYPQFFVRDRRITFGQTALDAYGNLFFLRNPDKLAVKISSKDSNEAVENKIAYWLSQAREGTVLVSPFISAKEKDVRQMAEAADASIILIVHETLPERYKPEAHNFAQWAKGRWLILSMGLPVKTPLSREICIQMNELAEKLASGLGCYR